MCWQIAFGYANGRFAEIMGKGYIPYQLVCNAENFIEKAKGYGLKISNTPTTGGIMVWMKGSTLSGNDGAGHVAVVERKNSDGSIYTSESGWGGPTFFNSTRNNSNGRWGQGSAYTFRGCIVNPSVNDDPTPTPSTDVSYIQRTLNERYGFNIAVDNIAGPDTWKHLRMALQIEFNKQFGSNLVIDGIFGPATQSVMNRAIIAYGARGNITWLIQACLNIKGYKTGGIDGIWLGDTQTAVGNFQQNNGLQKDYKVGKNTYLKLFN